MRARRSLPQLNRTPNAPAARAYNARRQGGTAAQDFAERGALQGAYAPPRNQVAELPGMALEMTGLPSIRRSAAAFASGDPGTGTLEGVQGGIGVLSLAAGMRGARGAPRAPVQQEMPSVRRVWHVSPHEFEPEPGAPLGRFRTDLGGSGESGGSGVGALAYGPGGYFTESPGVRDFYYQQFMRTHGRANIYEAEIPADGYMDFETPYGRQPSNVRDGLREIYGDGPIAKDADSRVLNYDEAARMRRRGIVGTRFRGGIRDSDPNLRNYAVFNGDDIRLLRRVDPGDVGLTNAPRVAEPAPAATTNPSPSGYPLRGGSDRTGALYAFDGPRNTEYRIYIDNPRLHPSGLHKVEFAEVGPGSYRRNVSEGGNPYGQIGGNNTGDALRVYRSVVEAIRRDAASGNPRPGYVWSGATPEQQRLYEAAFRKLDPPPGFARERSGNDFIWRRMRGARGAPRAAEPAPAEFPSFGSEPQFRNIRDDSEGVGPPGNVVAVLNPERRQSRFGPLTNPPTRIGADALQNELRHLGNTAAVDINALPEISLRTGELPYFRPLGPDESDTVAAYARRSAETAPPIIIRRTAGGMQIIDGHQRVMAARRRGDAAIRALDSSAMFEPPPKPPASKTTRAPAKSGLFPLGDRYRG